VGDFFFWCPSFFGTTPIHLELGCETEKGEGYSRGSPMGEHSGAGKFFEQENSLLETYDTLAKISSRLKRKNYDKLTSFAKNCIKE
jgi:hypothetical protein